MKKEIGIGIVLFALGIFLSFSVLKNSLAIGNILLTSLLNLLVLQFSLGVSGITERPWSKAFLATAFYFILLSILSFILSAIPMLGPNAIAFAGVGILGILLYAILLTVIIQKVYKLSFRKAGGVALLLVIIVRLLTFLLSFIGFLK